MIRERNAVAGFLVLILMLMGFYVLGLLLGHGETETALATKQPPGVGAKPKLTDRDPRSELDFINSSAGSTTAPQQAEFSGATSLPKHPGGKPAAVAVNEKHRTRGFAVQVGTFTRKQDAEQAAAGLVRRGYNARVVSAARDHAKFRILVGRYGERNQAESAARKLNKPGFVATVIRAP